jgi:hypothetical protein
MCSLKRIYIKVIPKSLVFFLFFQGGIFLSGYSQYNFSYFVDRTGSPFGSVIGLSETVPPLAEQTFWALFNTNFIRSKGVKCVGISELSFK